MNLINVLVKGENSSPPPIWVMRQAGRHLPEYLALREKEPNFIRFCLDPRLCVEATLQPIKRYDMDAAVLFSDILLAHYGMGYEVEYGPKGISVRGGAKGRFDIQKIAPVAEAVKEVRQQLDEKKALIGFCGAPWTLFSYSIGTKPPYRAIIDFVRQEDPKPLKPFIEAAIAHLKFQIRAGVDAVMLFDSWSGIVPDHKLMDYVFLPQKQVVDAIRAEFPKVGIIGFPHGIASNRLAEYANFTGVDGVSVDDGTDPFYIADALDPKFAIQGNLSPWTLKNGGKGLEQEVKGILRAFSNRPHIFNLGHGILPSTPIKNVEKLIDLVKSGI